MKKLLSLLTFFTCILVQAQDVKLIEQLRSCDYEQAKAFADLVASGRTEWELIKEVNSDKALTFTYLEKSVPKDTKEAIKVGKLLIGDLNRLIVKFTVFHEGEDKNLEIKGVKKYVFYNASGKYLDLFPLWQKVFKQDADVNITPKKYSMQEYKQGTYLYKFKEATAPYWMLEKFY